MAALLVAESYGMDGRKERKEGGLNIMHIIVSFPVLGPSYGTVHQTLRQIAEVFEQVPLQMGRAPS